MGVKSLPKLLLIYSVVVLVFLIIIASNVEVEVKRLRRDDHEIHQPKLIPREEPDFVPDEPYVPASPETVADGNEKDPESHQHKCSIVHLAFVAKDVRALVTHVIKSVLIHRHCPLHLHFIADSFNQSVLQKLLSTWELPYVEYSFYSTSYIKQNLTLRSNIQLSQVLEMSPLLLPYVLPKTIDNVIVLDSNVLVVTDIRELWLLSLELNTQNKLFAVSKSSSLQGYFDTNVMIMNLKVMRSSNWDQLWQSVVKNSPNRKYVTHDIINSIIVAYPDSMSVLPCAWNINPQTQLTCSLNVSDYRILVLTPRPDEGSDSYADTVQNIEQMVQQYDSPGLRSIPTLCNKSGLTIRGHDYNKLPPLPRRSRREMCRLISREHERTFVTHLYYYGTKYEPREGFETTLVTQLSLDRLDKFRLLLSHWDGPMSLSMYGTDAEALNLTLFMKNENINRDNVVIHVLYKQGRFYPVNYLRNLALDTVQTPYMFLSDGDFLPSFGLFDHLKAATKVLMNDGKKRALVIPAFNGEEGFIFPSTKEDLQDQLDKGSVRMFCVWCAHQTHGQTNYTVWATATRPYKVEWAFHFEPYVVVDRDTPRYDERFVGYGWNKVSQITELKAQGYEFVVLPKVFTIHSPHKRTTDREIWKRKNYKFCINSLWKRFIQDLLQKYGPECLMENHLVPVMLDVEV